MQYSENRGIRGRFSSTADRRLDESGYAAYLHNQGTWAIFSENFSSIRLVLSSPLAVNNNKKKKKKMKQTCLPNMNPKTPPGLSKSIIIGKNPLSFCHIKIFEI